MSVDSNYRNILDGKRDGLTCIGIKGMSPNAYHLRSADKLFDKLASVRPKDVYQLVERAVRQEEGPEQQTAPAASPDGARLKSVAAPAQFEDVRSPAHRLTLACNVLLGAAAGHLRRRDGFRHHVMAKDIDSIMCHVMHNTGQAEDGLHICSNRSGLDGWEHLIAHRLLCFNVEENYLLLATSYCTPHVYIYVCNSTVHCTPEGCSRGKALP